MISRTAALAVALLASACANAPSPSPSSSPARTPTAQQLINASAAVAQVADIVATDAPLYLHGGASTTLVDATNAVSAASTKVAASGLDLGTAQGIQSAVNQLVSAAQADPQVSSNPKIMADLALAQATIAGVVAIWETTAARRA